MKEVRHGNQTRIAMAKPKQKLTGSGLYRSEYNAAFNDRHYGATRPLGPIGCSCQSPGVYRDATTDYQPTCWKCGRSTRVRGGDR